MLVIERFYNPVILVSLSPIKHQSLLEVSERRATCRGEKAATSLKEKAEFLQSLLERLFFGEETSSGVAKCRQGFLRLGCDRIWKVLRSTEKDIFTNCKLKLTMESHTF